jgi:hypothetical protein
MPRNPKSEDYAEASRILKAELVRRDMTYKGLANLLTDENYVQLKTKINRGSFSAAFFIKVLRAMGATDVDISRRSLPRREHAPPNIGSSQRSALPQRKG